MISPRNMQLPFWLLTFEEIVEVLVGDSERKAEIDILQDLIPIAKSRYSTGRSGDSTKLRRGSSNPPATRSIRRFPTASPISFR